MPAYAYLRKSSVRDPARDLSPVAQEAAVRELAGRHGDAEGLIVLSDMDKSGRLGRDKRPGYAALLEAIEGGVATAVYSYSLSRLGRSLPELSRLIADCDARHVAVRLYADGLDTTTASGRLLANVLGSVAQFEAEVASERVRAAHAAKLARGEPIGTAHAFGERDGEDAAAVLAAFREAGSYSGAAKLLNGQGIAPRTSKRGWWPSAVAVIVKRLDRTVVVRSSTRGASAGGSDFVLARLLTCPTCGTRLSGTRDRLDGPNRGRVRYACRLGCAMPHQRVSISEHLIMPAIHDEAARLMTPDEVESGHDDAGPRADLEARRERILDLYEAGHVDRAERERRMAAVNDQIRALDTRRIVRAVPYIDWSWPPRELNGVLRALFERIELDPGTFQPRRFTWRFPEWRAKGRRRPSARTGVAA